MNVAQYFDARAEKYEQALKSPIISRSRADEHRILNWLVLNNFSHKDPVLEIGCGTGYYTLMLSNVCKKVTAIDVSAGMLKVLNKKIKMNGTKNVEVFHTDFTQMNNKKFNSVFCASVLGYVDEPENFIKKIY